MSGYVLSMAGGFIMSAATMPLWIRLARRFGVVDNPTHRKIHSAPTPYLGGLGLVFGFTLIPLIYGYFFRNLTWSEDLPRLAAVVGPSLAAALLGLADDKRPIRAKVKLVLQIAIALTFVVFCFRLEAFKLPGFGRYEYQLFDIESIPLTVLWMLGVINGLNLVDGIDGLAGSVSAAIFGGIGVLALTLDQPDELVALIAFAACGASLGFLLFNWSPAKIYMGDTGSLACGTLMATLLLAVGQSHVGGTPADVKGYISEPFPYQFAKITLLAFYPLTEITLSMVRRFLSGKPIGSADKGHIHHRLLQWGWNAPMVCAAAVLMTAFAAATVYAVQLHYNGVASGLLLAGGIQFVLLLHFCGFLEMLHPKSIRGNRPHFLIANHFIAMQRIKLELAQTVGEIAVLTEQTCIEFGVEQYSMHLVPDDAAAKPFELHWTKPATAHGSILLTNSAQAGGELLPAFADRAALPSGTHAEWRFEPHAVEEEIDVEYRVLMSEFMRKALGCAEHFHRDRPIEGTSRGSDSDNSTRVRSSELRRRKVSSEKLNAAPRSILPLPRPDSSGAHGE